MQEEVSLPNFPSLERCLIVESRHSVRTEVVNSINSSSLFLELVIAESVSDGLKRIRKDSFDACIVGTSVSTQTADNFFEQAELETKSDDCAFILLIDNASDTNKVESELKKSKPHGKIKFPTTKRQFTEEVVKSVVKANHNSPWTSLYTKMVGETNQEYIESVSANKLPTVDSGGSASSILGANFEVLEEIIEGINLGIYKLDDNGRPTIKTSQALDKVFEDLFKVKAKTGKLKTFSSFFRSAVEEWFVEYTTGDQDLANKNFKSKLFGFMKICSS